MPSAAAQSRYPKARVDALTDGIFAVAMTLLVLDIHLPEGFQPTDAAQLVHGLLELLPKFVPYVLSFLLLGMRWLSLVQDVHGSEHVAGPYVKWWLLYLLLITCVPFSTIVIGRYANFAPAIWVYCLNTALMALASWRMVQLTSSADNLHHRRHRQVSMVVLLVSSLVCVGVSFVDPLQAIWAFALNLVAPLLTRFLERRERS